jgi:hypothetical protein
MHHFGGKFPISNVGGSLPPLGNPPLFVGFMASFGRRSTCSPQGQPDHKHRVES